MLLSFIIFFLILGLSVALSKLPFIISTDNKLYQPGLRRNVNFFSQYIFPIILITLLIGLRYDVGVDWFAYNSSYNNIPESSLWDSINKYNGYEWLFATILYGLRALGLPNYSIFIFTTGLILTLYYATFRDMPKVLPYALFTLFTLDTFFLFLNIMRQAVSFFIILYSIKFIKNRQLLKYILGIVLAAGFHKTAYLLLPFYCLAYYKRILFNKWIAFGIYFTTWFASDKLFNGLLDSVSFLLDNQYSEYTNSIQLLEMTKQSGLGLLMLHICDLIIIYCSPICDKTFRGARYDIYYNLFFVGVAIQNIAGMNMLLARVPFCLTSMRLVAGAFTLCFGLSYAMRCVRKKTGSKNLYRCLCYLFMFCALAFLVGNCMRFNYSFVFNH